MKVGGVSYRSVWREPDGAVGIIDQTALPHAFVTKRLTDLNEVAHAIRNMQVRGAPLIGATAAYGLALALARDASNQALAAATATLLATRPTAVNLSWALAQIRSVVAPLPPAERAASAASAAQRIADDDVAICRQIGVRGLPLIRAVHERTAKPVRVMTHCNAGWLATVDWGTALAPVYLAHDQGVPVHVWVSETRPRNQGQLTAWELGQHEVPHTAVVDSACGHLIERGQVDLVIVGTDRTTARGDVVNKIGTYLKALAARASNVPFYAALPSPSIDWATRDARAVPIEERDANEVLRVRGKEGELTLWPAHTRALNPAFDVTPAALVTGLITERGVCAPSDLRALFARQ